MRATAVFATALFAGAALAAPASTNETAADEFARSKEQGDAIIASAKQKALDSLEARAKQLRHRGETPNCTTDNLTFRKEYGTLSRDEKLDYIRAVKCLRSLPPRTPANVSAGAVSRFDDFTVVHIQQTLTIHYTGNFMPWHRWFVYLYEKALREECGYQGYQPYWDWPRYASSPETSPLFDGNDTSLGGNGDYVEHTGPVIVPPEGVDGGNIQLPAGTGGGFVTTGAFANMTITLGPVGGEDGVAPGVDGGLGSNPRGLKRDLGGAMNTRYANYTTVLNLLQSPNISAYRHVSEGVPYTVEIGPHGGIHYTIGGDPGGDLFTSPGDPAFWTHHSQMDRMWTVWQAIDPSTRQYDLNATDYGHRTWANSPESNYTELTDVIDMGYAGPSTTISEVMDTMSGPFCYFYL